MNKNSLYISVVALIVSVVAVVASFSKCDKAVKTTVTAVDVKKALDTDPKMVIDAIEKYQQQQQELEMKKAAEAFEANIEDINNNPDTPFVGKKDAKVVLVEFFDFSCGYCKRLAPAMEEIVKNNSDIKVVFKPITFVSPISKYAAQAALAANNQGKFMDMYKVMLAAPERLTEESINAMAEKAGLDMDKYNADVKSEKVSKIISDVATLADKIQIRGVPALVLNGRQLQVIDAEGIQAEINKVK